MRQALVYYKGSTTVDEINDLPLNTREYFHILIFDSEVLIKCIHGNTPLIEALYMLGIKVVFFLKCCDRPITVSLQSQTTKEMIA